MQTINIPSSEISPRANYVRHVIRQGHVPGTLSGAELQGRARAYGVYYLLARKRAASVVAAYGVQQNSVLINSRWSRVWTNADGKPVQLAIV